MTLFDHFVVLTFAVLYPAYAFFTYRNVKKDLIANKPGARTRDYKETIAWLWFLSVIAMGVWIYNDRLLADIGLGFSLSWPVWISLFLIVLAAIFLIFQYRSIRHDKKQRQSLRDKLSNVDASEYLPRTEQEVRWFVLVSISAGICEELLFRGFLMWYFNVFSVTSLAVVLSSILFGMAHSYQGWKGGLRAGVVGLVLALSYVLLGSLWIPILLHIVGDIHSGMLGWLAFEEDKQVESA